MHPGICFNPVNFNFNYIKHNYFICLAVQPAAAIQSDVWKMIHSAMNEYDIIQISYIAEDYSIKFKKGSYAYKYMKDRIWGEYQEIREVEDGYILEFEATQYKPILRWVLGWDHRLK